MNIAKRVNCNLKAMLVTLTSKHKDWDVNISELRFATQTMVNRSTELTPPYLNLGNKLTYPWKMNSEGAGRLTPIPSLGMHWTATASGTPSERPSTRLFMSGS